METRIRKLYDRFLEGKATKEEINEIYDRITATPEELKEFREYEKFWEQIHKPSEEVLASLADVKATIKSYKRRRAWRCSESTQGNPIRRSLPRRFKNMS